jgi:membrane protein YqaA with SNARE-associated domain
MITRLYQTMMRLASHRHALLWLAVVSFIESSVFPIPPDVMLIPMVLATPSRAWRYALVAALSSVAGGWLGYGIGALLFDSVGRQLIGFYHLQASFQAFQAMFQTYGGWIVLAKGLTPIPFKLVTIASGAAHLDPWVFTLSALGSRLLRFFLVAGLLYHFGAPIRAFVERRLVLATSAALAALIGGFFILRLI